MLPKEKEINVLNDCGATEDTFQSESTVIDDADDTTTSSLPYTLPTTELTSSQSPYDVVTKRRDSFVWQITTNVFAW